MRKNFRCLAPFVCLVITFKISANCPNNTDPVNWKKWQALKVEELFKSRFSSKTAFTIRKEFDECLKLIDASAETKECTYHLNQFATSRSWSALKGHSLGASMTDFEYESNVPYPEMLELPKQLAENQEFLKALDERSDLSAPPMYEKAFEVIEKINAKISDPKLKWIPFVYDSQHLATPDGTDSMGRFFIYIPHSDYDRFLQFGIQRDPNLPLSKSFSTVSVQKTDPLTHQLLSIPRGRMKDFWRLRDKEGNVSLSTRLKVMGSMENCQNCHKNLLLPIHPEPTTFDKYRFQVSVDKVNEIMRGYGHVSGDGWVHNANGPGMGPEESAVRTDEFIRQCSNGAVTTVQDIEKVKSAMNCTQCHDGLYRGTLNYPSGNYTLPVSENSSWGTLIDHYIIKHKLMPPYQEDLSDIERKSVAVCLKAEYYQDFKGQTGLLKSWLLQKECWKRKN